MEDIGDQIFPDIKSFDKEQLMTKFGINFEEKKKIIQESIQQYCP